MKKVLVFFALTLGVASTGLALRSTLSKALVQSGIPKSELPKGNVRGKLDKFTKRVRVNTLISSPSVAIRLSGLHPEDIVNIRPTEKSEIEVSAGVLVDKDETRAGAKERLSKSSLELSSNEIVFTRPQTFEETVLLDIQLPPDTQAEISVDGKLIVTSILREPVSVRNGELGQGESSEVSLLLKAVIPAHVEGMPRFSQHVGGNGRFVPLSDLQLIKKVEVDASSPKNRAILEINEEGKVVKVTLLSRDPDPGLEDALKQWQFAPHVVDGRPSPVTTMLTPSKKGQ